LKERLKNSNLDDSIKNFFLSEKKAIIFGAGQQGYFTYLYCLMYEKNIAFLMTSGSRTRHHLFPHADELPLLTLDEFDMEKNDYDIIIAVNEKYNDELQKELYYFGFQYIFISMNWCNDNIKLTEIFGDGYIQFIGGNFSQSIDNQRIVTCCLPPPHLITSPEQIKTMLRFYYPEEMNLYKRTFIGQIFSTMSVELFSDFRNHLESPYQIEPHVKLCEGDVVFDCGANIGIFSIIAAVRGCIVYAFEPAPYPAHWLKLNAQLYNYFTVFQNVVSEREEEISFFVYDGHDDNSTCDGGNKFCIHDDYSKITVNSLSIDNFIERNNIRKLDFIKADIEGAEREMLAGARKTLARFSPKLAICSYHLPDDPQVLERLILEANPRYVVKHHTCRYSKIFAYVPR
jgi:FkbM family methyltransferase